MRRYSDIIDSNKGQRFEVLQSQWTVFQNFLNMYLDIEKMLCDAQLATHLPTPVYMNAGGEEVEEVSHSIGCKVKVKLDLPQLCLVMDEVGDNLNMLNNGRFGGKKFLSRKGNVAKINSTKKSKKFTVLGVTNLKGNPVMCIVIFEGKERNVFLESGVDPFHPLFELYTAEEDHLNSNFSFFEDNYGPGQLFPGGPVCEFKGIKVPTMIRYSKKGSITPEILTNILRTIDGLQLFKVYRDNGATPFLLVD